MGVCKVRTVVCNVLVFIYALAGLSGVLSILGLLRKPNGSGQQGDKEGRGYVLYALFAVVAIVGLLLATYYHVTSTKVANVVGFDLGNAIQTLQEADIYVEVRPDGASWNDAVIEQSVAAGVYVSRGSTITLITDHTDDIAPDGGGDEPGLPEPPSLPDDGMEPSDNGAESTEPTDSSEPPESGQFSSSLSEEYIYFKRDDVMVGSLGYLEPDGSFGYVNDPDLSEIQVLRITLFTDSDVGLGAAASISLRSGPGFAMTTAFYNGMSFDISPGTYNILFCSPEKADLFGEGQPIDPQYLSSVEVTFDHSGDYTVHVEW